MEYLILREVTKGQPGRCYAFVRTLNQKRTLTMRARLPTRPVACRPEDL